MKNQSADVHAGMNESSPVIRTLKKGDGLILDLQIAGPSGDWCRVRLPGKSARLGYVNCAALTVRATHHNPPSPAESPGEPGASAGRPAPPIHLSLSSPASRYLAAYKQIQKLVVHDDEIDTVKLEEIDREAKTGIAAATDRAVLAHIAAGRFDFSEKETGDAVEQFQSAVSFSAHNPHLLLPSLLDLASIHLVRSEYGAARKSLERAKALDPNSAVVAELLGLSDYRLDRLNRAVAELQEAQRLHPNPQVAALLAKANLDRQTEKHFHRRENSHFVLRYEGGATPELAGDILSALEGDFQTLQSALEFTPAQPIPVILYTNQTFRDVTRAPKWSAAINDGRIRIPVQGLTSVTPTLARELRHELTHSFVRQMTDGRCPTWLNEGLAQYFEGRRSSADAKILVTLYKEKKYIPLKDLEGSWMSFPSPVASYAYAWSLAAVESIIANSGMYGIQRLFIRLKEEDSSRMALERALQLSYSDLQLQTIQYLQRTYLHEGMP